MAHHQHHGRKANSDVAKNSLQSRSAIATAMPAISEDEHVAECDEPPDMASKHELDQLFTKTIFKPAPVARRESLLTKALHIESDHEKHDNHSPIKSPLSHCPSRSSTCSTQDTHSFGTWTSDDLVHSPSTRASTPSPLRPSTVRKTTSPPNVTIEFVKPTTTIYEPSNTEAKVETELGRKRCISFFCKGSKPGPAVSKPAEQEPEKQELASPEPVKRPCALRFICPSRVSTDDVSKTGPPKVSRHLSPAPPAMQANNSSPPASGSRRSHRDSDSTVKVDSPKSFQRGLESLHEVDVAVPARRACASEATRFHEFAASDEEIEDWLQQSTCHRSRLTVEDTLKRENEIRKLTEDAEEEAIEDEDDDEEEDEGQDDDEIDPFSDYELEDDGFQSDIEAGFASSDDDSDDGSDYEWWAPRRSAAATAVNSPFVPSVDKRKVSNPHTRSDTSDGAVSPSYRPRRNGKATRSRPLDIRPKSPELPDSTDFVCGTLDEDRPLEEAYLISMREKKAAKQRAKPQDIDPSFPTSDPELANKDDLDEEDEISEEEIKPAKRSRKHSEQHRHKSIFMQNFEIDEEPRGRKQSNGLPKPCNTPPRRAPSPAPTTAKRIGRSPAPRGMFHASPKRLRSPAPPPRLASPPSSLRGTPSTLRPHKQMFLGEASANLTHTSSLPRSPAPFIRRRRCSRKNSDQEDEDDDATEQEKPYARGAIDIIQGLECKRLKRREKLYRQYWKREEKRKDKRPQPGRGAQRMRQIGIECAIYRGKRVLSI